MTNLELKHPWHFEFLQVQKETIYNLYSGPIVTELLNDTYDWIIKDIQFERIMGE
jgi:hypothetical protein